MDLLYLSENVGLSGVYSTNEYVHITEGVSVFTCALMCTSYAFCSSIFHNNVSEKCILIHGFHFTGEKFMSGEFWHYFRPVTQYTVAMSYENGVDTANLFLTIFGSKGNTDELIMEVPVSDCILGHECTHTFMFQSVDVGEITRIKIRHGTSSFMWYSASIGITKTGGFHKTFNIKERMQGNPLYLTN